MPCFFIDNGFMGILEDDKFIGRSFSSLLGLEVLADGLAQHEKLERLNDRLADSQNIQNKEQFKYGFAMGVLLMKEVYEHPEFKPKE